MPTSIHRAVLAATLAAAIGGVAHAQQTTPQQTISQQTTPQQPTQLEAIQGKVAQYSLTPRGDVDGLILDNGTEVHFPPPLSTQLVFIVRPGDSVTVHGLQAMAGPMVQAQSITNSATGQTVSAPGPRGFRPPPPPPGQSLSAQGQVKEQLHGPRGELNGVLLTDGTIVRLPPPEAERLASQLAQGATVVVSGHGYAGPLGKVIAAESIGPSASQQTAIAAPPPPPHHHGHHHGPRPAGGPDMPPPPDQAG